MKHLFPGHNFELTTHVSMPDFCTLLWNETTRIRFYGWDDDRKPARFQGHVGTDSFVIARYDRGSSRFVVRPVVIGRLAAGGNGSTTIKAKLTLNPVMWAFIHTVAFMFIVAGAFMALAEGPLALVVTFGVVLGISSLLALIGCGGMSKTKQEFTEFVQHLVDE